MKKLITLFLALIALSPYYTAKADWVKNVTLAKYDFTLAPSFTHATSNMGGSTSASSNSVIVPLGTDPTTTGYMYCAGSGGGARGTKITNITTADARQDTVYYEFDWNPYRLQGISASTGAANNDPGNYGICVVRDSRDSIVFGLWYDRWSTKAGSPYNRTGDEAAVTPQGDIHLMNLSTDPNNPMPAKVVTQTKPDGVTTWSYYTNTLLPFAMQNLNVSTNFYAMRCDSINQSTDLGPTFVMCNWYHIKAAIDFKNKKIISFDINLNGSTEVTRHFENLPFVNTAAYNVARLEVAGTRGKAEGVAGNGQNCDYQQRFDNIEVYTMHQVAASANVTVKYQDMTGTELQASRVVPNIEIGKVYHAIAGDKINLVYGGDFYLYDAISVDSVTVVKDAANEIILKFNKANPKATIIQAFGPGTSEIYNDVTINFTVATLSNDIVSGGKVNILVNGNIKNSVTPDVLGTGSVTFPNLLAGTNTIKVVYVGDRISYSTSDTTTITIQTAPSSASVVPYPVYYDLGTMPEIMKYRLKYAATLAVSGHSTGIAFAGDSLKSLVLATDTTKLTKTMFLTWSQTPLTGPTSGKTADQFAASDKVDIPYGNGARPSWMQFTTPWLNKGGYNVYLNQRTNTTGMLTNITMDDKSLYFPNAELDPYYIRGGSNRGRRWNANTNDGLNQMAYLGSINLDASGTHKLKFTCPSTSETSANQVAWIDMLQFIPIDQDSLTINVKASVGLNKLYLPLFSSGGFALTATASFLACADPSEMAVTYQATDPSSYEKTSYTLQHLAVTDPNLGSLGIDYVVIFKNDKWTRVAEGAINTLDSTFTTDLAKGTYYYQEYNYKEKSLIPGSMGNRVWMKDGEFTVGPGTAVKNTLSSNINTYSVGKSLIIRGIKPGAKITVTDLMGKTIMNTVATADIFSTAINHNSVYIVKVVSGNDTKTSKVIIK